MNLHVLWNTMNLFQRNPSVGLAYELADLKIQIDDIIGANTNITYGIANSSDEMMKPYYETQTLITPIKAGFLYLKALLSLEKTLKQTMMQLLLFWMKFVCSPEFNLATLAKMPFQIKNWPWKNKNLIYESKKSRKLCDFFMFKYNLITKF